MDRHKNLLESCVKELHSCIDYVRQYSNDKEQQFDILGKLAKKYSEIDIEYEAAQKACKDTIAYFNDLENDSSEDVEEIYRRYVNNTSKQTFEGHSIWRNISKAIGGESTSGAMEQSNDTDNSTDDENTIDEGIIATQFEPPIDPITKQIIENPCKNRKCGHVYEHWVIIDHLKKIKQNKVKSRCPYIGCTNTNMRPSFIIQDDALKEKIEDYKANHCNVAPSEVSSYDVTI